MVRLLCHCTVIIHSGHSSHGRGIPTVLLYGGEVATYHVTVWKISIIWLDGREPTMLLYGRDVPTRLPYGRAVPTKPHCGRDKLTKLPYDGDVRTKATVW